MGKFKELIKNKRNDSQSLNEATTSEVYKEIEKLLKASDRKMNKAEKQGKIVVDNMEDYVYNSIFDQTPSEMEKSAKHALKYTDFSDFADGDKLKDGWYDVESYSDEIFAYEKYQKDTRDHKDIVKILRKTLSELKKLG